MKNFRFHAPAKHIWEKNILIGDPIIHYFIIYYIYYILFIHLLYIYYYLLLYIIFTFITPLFWPHLFSGKYPLCVVTPFNFIAFTLSNLGRYPLCVTTPYSSIVYSVDSI